MSRIKKLVVIMAFTLLTSSMVVCAQSYTNKKVYGDRYVVVVDGKSVNLASHLTVTIDEIYEADGSDSNYEKVKADVLNKDSDQISVNTDNTLKKGEAVNIPLVQNYGSGITMKLRMKGNVSFLDCIVDFTAALSS